MYVSRPCAHLRRQLYPELSCGNHGMIRKLYSPANLNMGFVRTISLIWKGDSPTSHSLRFKLSKPT